MFPPETFADRRATLAEAVGSGLIVLLGNRPAAMNYAANHYPFRQDGTFLYYTGLDAPHLALTLDAETGEATLYGPEPTMDDAVWEGSVTPLSNTAEASAIARTAFSDDLAETVRRAVSAGREVHTLPAYRSAQASRLATLLGDRPETVKPSERLIEAVIVQRLVKTDSEVEQIEVAIGIAAEMHRRAMQMAQPGTTELEVAAEMERIARMHGGYTSFPVILTRRGEVLHNRPTHAALAEGDLMLADGGAHAPHSRYTSDITRTVPVGGRFSERQRAAYSVVLRAQEEAIEACRPGQSFREVHDLAARTLVEGLVDLGLMKGDPDEAVAAGAHALFFPHGLGHPMGLDVHDMEALGEDRVGYGDEAARSNQFGTAFLRFGRPLREGHVMTVEPGFYVIGPLLEQWRAEGTCRDFLDFDAIRPWVGFGGIRIEDDVLITAAGPRVLGPGIPKQPGEVEAVVRSGA